MATENENLTNFIKWLKEKGFKNDNLEIFSIAHHRGIKTKKIFLSNEILLKVAENIIITTDTVLRCQDLKEAISVNSGLLQPFDALCLFIMCEKLKESDSEWSSYINILPESYSNPVTLLDSNSPHLFPPKTRETFSIQINEINAVKRRIQTVFHTWAKQYRAKNNYEFDETLFLWAWCTVNTRCIYKSNISKNVFNNLEGDTIALVPFLDMINHSPEPKIEAKFSRLTKCYELILNGGAINENMELFISYGPHSNSKLFIDYGFVLIDNPNNVIKFDFDDFREILENYKKIDGPKITENHWSTLSIAQLNTCSIYSTQIEPSWNFMAVFGLLNFNENQLLSWKKIYSISDFFEDTKTVEMAKYFLNSYLYRLKDKMPKDEEFEKIANIYTKDCLLQLWNDEIFIVNQCLDQF